MVDIINNTNMAKYEFHFFFRKSSFHLPCVTLTMLNQTNISLRSIIFTNWSMYCCALIPIVWDKRIGKIQRNLEKSGVLLG